MGPIGVHVIELLRTNPKLCVVINAYLVGSEPTDVYTHKTYFPFVSTFVSPSLSIKRESTLTTCYMQRIEHLQRRTSLFIFDLEFIGDVRELHTCRIWEIAVFCVATNQWFVRVVDPDPSAVVFPEPPIPEIPRLTRAFLGENNASLWVQAIDELIMWVRSQCTVETVPVFISHNTFRADKPILELECRRSVKRLPLTWYFFDSLHFSRSVVRNPLGNYSLSGLYEQMFNSGIENVHRAKSDVLACTKILQGLTNNTWCLTGPMYPSYSTSVRSIRWIGRKAEELMYVANIRSAEMLFSTIKQNVQQDYLLHNMSEASSILKTLTAIFGRQLPEDNIRNIMSVVNSMRATNPFSYTFMLTPY